MERKQYPLKGGLFPLIAILLALFAIVGLFSVLRPEAALLDAAGESLEELEERDETLLRLMTLFREGRLTATVGGKEVLTVTGGTDVRCLSLKGEKKLSLYRAGDELLLKTEDAETLGGTDDALHAYLASALESTEERRLLAAFAALSDGRLTNDALLTEAETFLETASPTLTREEADFSHGEEEGRATLYRLTAEGEPMAESMSGLSELSSVKALFHLLSSLTGEGTARRAAVSAFFEGEGELYGALEENTSLTADFTVFDGLLRRTSLTLTGKDASLTVTLSLDGTDSTLSLAATLGEQAWSLSLADTVTEDKKSYLRELTLTLTEQGESRESRLRFSWGKTKNDLALRWTLPETEYYFRGTLEERKKSRVVFTLSRIERDKENILPAPLQFTLTDETEALTPPRRDGDFPEEVTAE